MTSSGYSQSKLFYLALSSSLIGLIILALVLHSGDSGKDFRSLPIGSDITVKGNLRILISRQDFCLMDLDNITVVMFKECPTKGCHLAEVGGRISEYKNKKEIVASRIRCV